MHLIKLSCRPSLARRTAKCAARGQQKSPSCRGRLPCLVAILLVIMYSRTSNKGRKPGFGSSIPDENSFGRMTSDETTVAERQGNEERDTSPGRRILVRLDKWKQSSFGKVQNRKKPYTNRGIGRVS